MVKGEVITETRRRSLVGRNCDGEKKRDKENERKNVNKLEREREKTR